MNPEQNPKQYTLEQLNYIIDNAYMGAKPRVNDFDAETVDMNRRKYVVFVKLSAILEMVVDGYDPKKHVEPDKDLEDDKNILKIFSNNYDEDEDDELKLPEMEPVYTPENIDIALHMTPETIRDCITHTWDKRYLTQGQYDVLRNDLDKLFRDDIHRYSES